VSNISPDLPYFLAFARVKGIGASRTRLLQAYFDTMHKAWCAGTADLARAGLDQKTISAIVETRKTIDPQKELDMMTKQGIHALTWEDADYPIRLKDVKDAPPVLFMRGAISAIDALAIGIVGTRNASVYGREATEMLATDLAKSGFTVVSGLARGIDAVAHKTAIEQNGRTIAVLGSGVDVIYPPEHRKLAQQIVENGAIISDYPPGTQPDATHFPPRNRIISGLSMGVVVVEADERSGALITTQFAAEQGRDVFAVPGNIFSKTSRGTNKLIQTGAKLVTSVNDILEEYNVDTVASQLELLRTAQDEIEKTDVEQRILNALSVDPIEINALIRQIDLPTEEITTALTMLELKGLIKQAGGAHYVLARIK
jgi:DNA processing protein